MPGTHPELRNTRAPGRPSALNNDVKKRILDVLSLGVPLTTAAEHAGLHRNTLARWLARGYSEHVAVDQGEDPIEEEAPFLELYIEVQQARAQAAIRNVGLVQKAAQGGYVTKVTEKKYKDVETGQIITERAEDIAGPDWRAAAWYLERAQPEDFGKNPVQVEVGGPGGGPVQIGEGVADLAAKLAAHIAANPTVPAITAAQVDNDDEDAETVDAELV